MNKEETNALQLLTGKSLLEDITVEELQQLADEHPYFSAAHILLCKKMQQTQHSQMQQQLYKTALYFPNEQWLRYLLLETGDQKNDDSILPQTNEEAGNSEADSHESISLTNLQDDDIIHNDIVTKPLTVETETANKDEAQDIITFPSKSILEEVAPLANNIQDEPEEAPLDEEELRQQTEPLPMEESNQKIATILSGQAEAFHKPVEEKTEVPITTEPFHTVDYFASQGIKLDGKREENSFDKKVHKFTDWLRQMKRINPHPADLGTETEEETQAATIADTSNYTKEIVTESMADVLIKQGKRDKAIEIYQKLGLLYPHKNTYFAALIQQIK